MKSTVALAFFVLFATTLVVGAEPPYDIPKLDNITIDGKGDDWGERGFRVAAFINTDAPANRTTPGSVLRIGWDKDGLLALITVADDNIIEGDKRIFDGASVEMLCAVDTGSPDLYYTGITPGLDPKHPNLRQQFIDLRNTPRLKKLDVDVVAQPRAGGYNVELRLPWANLGMTAAEGKLTAFTLWFNSKDTPETTRTRSIWSPYQWSYDSNKLHRLRLSREASNPVALAVSADYYRLHHMRVEINSGSELAGKTVTILEGETALGTCKLATSDGGASTLVEIPLPPYGANYAKLTAKTDDDNVVSFTVPDIQTARAAALTSLAVRPKYYVSDADTFPAIDFELPFAAEDLIGDYQLRVSYYDKNYHLVTKPGKPGRYGAVVEIIGKNGDVTYRFITLYHTAQPVKWDNIKIELNSPLPDALGIDPDVVTAQSKQLNTYLRIYVTRQLADSEKSSIIFAGLQETKTGATKQDTITNPREMNTAWWFGLKKKLALLEHKYRVFLPHNYGVDTTQKYPLILFLHGSGQRGDNLATAQQYGPQHYLATHQELPFITVVPQCPLDQWWYSEDIIDLLDEILAKYPVDIGRVILTGLSMGGFGTWRTAALHPERFAAIAPICGGGQPLLAPAMKNLPVWVFHGGRDTTVPLARSQEMVDALKKAGGNVKFTIFPEDGHDSWTDTYNTPELYTWFLAQRRGK